MVLPYHNAPIVTKSHVEFIEMILQYQMEEKDWNKLHIFEFKINNFYEERYTESHRILINWRKYNWKYKIDTSVRFFLFFFFNFRVDYCLNHHLRKVELKV